MEKLARAEIGDNHLAIVCRSGMGIYELEPHLRRLHGKRLGVIILQKGPHAYTLRQVNPFLPATHFGFRKITLKRPLRLNFQASPERIGRIEEERGFQALAQSKKKGAAGAKEQAQGGAQQEEIRKILRKLPTGLYRDRAEFEAVLEGAEKKAGLKLSAPVTKAILSALSERDETATICRDKEDNFEPDPELRDTESVPLSESVETFFEREVKPHVPDAWIDTDKRDEKDGKVVIVGYEINFNRYFYRYNPPRPSEEIEADIRAVERDTMQILAEVTGSTSTGKKVGAFFLRAETPIFETWLYRTKCRDLRIPSDVLYDAKHDETGGKSTGNRNNSRHGYRPSVRLKKTRHIKGFSILHGRKRAY